MAKVSLNAQQVGLMQQLRGFANTELRNKTFKSILAGIKQQYGIPDKHKLRTGNDDPFSSAYPLLTRKKDGSTYDINPATGKWVGAQATVVSKWFKVDLAAGLDATLAGIQWDSGLDNLPSGANVSDKRIGNNRVVGLTYGGDVTFYVEVTKSV